jgi:hypothetical protein
MRVKIIFINNMYEENSVCTSVLPCVYACARAGLVLLLHSCKQIPYGLLPMLGRDGMIKVMIIRFLVGECILHSVAPVLH